MDTILDRLDNIEKRLSKLDNEGFKYSAINKYHGGKPEVMNKETEKTIVDLKSIIGVD